MRGKHGSFTYLFNSEFFLGRRVTEVQTVNKPKESGASKSGKSGRWRPTASLTPQLE